MIKLYHGSNVEIVIPDLARSKPFKDFGKGFYLSPSRRQAFDMARQKVSQSLTGTPRVSTFLFDESLLESNQIKVLQFPDYSEEWALFVLANRDTNRPQPVHDYDVVYGPIADDGVTFQLKRYIGGVISLERLVEELKYARGITFQYYFGSQRALQLLQRI